MKSSNTILIAVVLGACGSVAVSAEKAARPEIVVPMLRKAPIVDGQMKPGEWDRAAALTGFIAPTGPLAGCMVPMESRVFLGHDGKRFYLAVHCQLPPGGKPTMNYRRRDEPVYMDRYQFELWLTPPARGNAIAYQMIANAYGAIYDKRIIPKLGAESASWNGNWKLENSYKTGEYWTAELSVPFADFVKEQTSTDGVWGGMVSLAWPQRSWPYTYGWYKNIDTHAKMVMSRGSTCTRVDSLASLFDNTLEPQFTLVNGENKPGRFTVSASVGDVRAARTVIVEANGTKKLTLAKALPAFPKGVKSRACRIEITGPDKTKLLAGDWLFRPIAARDRQVKAIEPKPWQMKTRVLFAPLARGVKAWADVLDYPRRDKLAAVRFEVRGRGGKAVVTHNVPQKRFAHDAAETLVRLPKDFRVGQYHLVTSFLDAGGKVLDKKSDRFEHKDMQKEFVWLDTDYGERVTVAPPFTPMEVKGRTLRVWGREIRMKGALPEQVVSQGAAMLARPISFVAVVEGRPVTATITKPFAVGKATAERVEFTGRYALAGLRLDVVGTVEFDGMIHYTVSARGKSPVLERLYVSMPVREENAKYYHSTAGGWSPSLGLISPDARGEIWSSTGVGDFVPYVGLSDDDRAIQWFADNDHDWILGSDAPCARLVRENNAVELQVNLVRRNGPVEKFDAKFGFIATPVKPMPNRWRHVSLHYATVADSRLNLFYGPGHGGCPIDPHDTAKLCRALKIDTKGKNPDVVLRDLPAGSVKPDMDHIEKMLGRKARETLAGLQSNSARRTCYFFNAKMYFPGNRSKAFQALFPGQWQLDPPSGWFHLTPTESYQDFFAFHMDLWMKHWFINGLYFDECYIAPDYNVFNGNGKIMPDGTVRPSVPLMKQRRFMNRMRQLFLNHRRKPFIWVHTSNYMAPHAISAADIAMFGEDKAPTPTADMIDTIPAALMRTIGRSQKFGFIPLWMVQAGRGGDGSRFVGRQSYGWCWMHDTVPEYHTSFRGHPLVALRKCWGFDEDDVQFLPYWKNTTAIKTSDPKFIVSAWTRDGGKLHLIVMNLHKDAAKADVTVTLDPKALALRSDCVVHDMETDPGAAAAEATYRQADRLRSQDAAGNRARISELVRAARSEGGKVRHNRPQWRSISKGLTIRLKVPARDFKMLAVQ